VLPGEYLQRETACRRIAAEQSPVNKQFYVYSGLNLPLVPGGTYHQFRILITNFHPISGTGGKLEDKYAVTCKPSFHCFLGIIVNPEFHCYCQVCLSVQQRNHFNINIKINGHQIDCRWLTEAKSKGAPRQRKSTH
jgi:hypothetical protein